MRGWRAEVGGRKRCKTHPRTVGWSSGILTDWTSTASAAVDGFSAIFGRWCADSSEEDPAKLSVLSS